MVQHLVRDPQKEKMYNDIIIKHEKRVFIERVTHPETTVGTCHYLPHHAMFKESATTPIRVVYECSCRQSQEHPSLNDILLPGPPIANDLTATLSYPDSPATSMVLQPILRRLDEQDRDATCFFCLSYLSDPNSPFRVYRSKVISNHLP